MSLITQTCFGGRWGLITGWPCSRDITAACLEVVGHRLGPLWRKSSSPCPALGLLGTQSTCLVQELYSPSGQKMPWAVIISRLPALDPRTALPFPKAWTISLSCFFPLDCGFLCAEHVGFPLCFVTVPHSAHLTKSNNGQQYFRNGVHSKKQMTSFSVRHRSSQKSL